MTYKIKQKTLFTSLVLSCLILSPLIGLASLPLFPMIGIWYQSEPLVIMLFGIATLSILTLYIGLLSSPRVTKWALYHPIVYLPALIAFLSLAFSFFHPYFLSDLLGNVQTGLGIAWFFSLAALSAVARLFSKVFSTSLKSHIFKYFSVSILTICFLSLRGVGEWKMFFFDDHLAFFAIYLWILPFLIFSNKTKAYTIAFISASLIILFSANLSAGLSLIAMMICTPLYYYIQPKYLNEVAAKNIAAGLGVILTVFLFISVLYLDDTFLFKSLHWRLESTMHSRHLLLSVIMDGLNSTPLSYIFGMGWGQFSESLVKNIPFDQTAVFNSGTYKFDQTLWIWDSLQRFDFHSHNLFIETLGGVGLLGLVFLLLYVFSLIRYAKNQCFGAAFACVIGFVLLNSMWFQMASSVGIMALAFGWMSGNAPTFQNKFKIPSWAAPAILIIPLFVLFFSCFTALSLAQQGVKEVLNNLEPEDMKQQSCSDFINDSQKNGYHFAELFRSYLNLLNQNLKSDSDTITSASWQRLDRYLCQSDLRLQQKNELVAGIIGLMARGDFAFKFHKFATNQPALVNRVLSGWSTNLDKVLVLAPRRVDLAIPYFNWLLENGKEDELYQRAIKITTNDSSNSIGLWFSGIVLLNKEGQFEKGIQHMRQAIESGIEKFLPVDIKIKKQLFPQS